MVVSVDAKVSVLQEMLTTTAHNALLECLGRSLTSALWVL